MVVNATASNHTIHNFCPVHSALISRRALLERDDSNPPRNRMTRRAKRHAERGNRAAGATDTTRTTADKRTEIEYFVFFTVVGKNAILRHNAPRKENGCRNNTEPDKQKPPLRGLGVGVGI
jgi:hypothetical protein